MGQHLWTPDSLGRDLRGLGLGRDDLVMVHSSMRAIGPTVGGADGVLDAIRDVVGTGGTIVVNVGVRDDWSWVNDHPEPERAALLVDAEPFDPLTTPSDPDNGVMAEVFRTRAGTVVSNHPEGRIAAAGPLATQLLADVGLDDYYGAGSPLERFVERCGRVLRLGADIDTITLLHYAENVLPLPNKRRVRRHRLVNSDSGPRIVVVDSIDDSDGIVDFAAGDSFTMMTQAYLATGRASIGVVGNATSELIDGSDLVRFAVEWMATHFAVP